jgi:hypothetical protein
MKTMIGIYDITLSDDADNETFETFMKEIVFPGSMVGRQTRGGIVTGQYLMKKEGSGSGKEYAWVVRWENQGGSPFGSADAPKDPAEQLAGFGARTAFTKYALKAVEP